MRNSLDYASRVKKIKNTVAKNTETKASELEDEKARLQQRLTLVDQEAIYLKNRSSQLAKLADEAEQEVIEDAPTEQEADDDDMPEPRSSPASPGRSLAGDVQFSSDSTFRSFKQNPN